MSYKSHRYIRVFFDKGPSNGGETKENTSPNESPEQETGDILVITKKIYEEFLKQLDRKDALKYINSGYLDTIEAFKKGNPSLKVSDVEIKKKIDILKNWYGGKSVFDENGVRIPVLAPDTEKNIQKSLGIKPKEVVNPESLTKEESEKVDTYIKDFKARTRILMPTPRVAAIQYEIQIITENQMGFSERIKNAILNRLQAENQNSNVYRDLQSIRGEQKNNDDPAKNNTNKIDALEKANKLTKETDIFHFSYFSKKAGVYLVKSMNDVSEELQKDVEGIDPELYEGLVKLPGYKDYLKNSLSPDALAALGLYAREKPNAPIFKDYPDSRDFFALSYETVAQKQTKGLTDGEIGYYNIKEFPILFPEFGKITKETGLEIPNTMKEALMRKDINGFYDELVKMKASNRNVAKYMKAISIDIERVSSGDLKELLTSSKKLGDNPLGSFQSQFDLSNKSDEERFNTLKNNKIQLGVFKNIEDITFLLSKLKSKDNNDSLYKSLYLIEKILIDAKSKGVAEYWHTDSMKRNPSGVCVPATEENHKAAENAGSLALQVKKDELAQNLSKENSNIPGIERFEDINSIKEELKRLKQIKEPTQKDLDAIAILETRLQNKRNVATATHDFITSPGVNREDAIAVIRGITGSKKTDQEIIQWIGHQEAIRIYENSGNTFSKLERGAAMMNIGESKTLGSLYETSENSEFMKCRVLVGGNNPFTRTVLSPEGKVVAKDIPIKNLDSTINQLERFYDSGLGKLAPYMEQVGVAINAGRNDKIDGPKGKYSNVSDLKFLKILATAIYGKENLPEDLNTPNLIKLFKSPDYEKSPEFGLRKLGILNHDGLINPTRLNEVFQKASTQVK